MVTYHLSFAGLPLGLVRCAKHWFLFGLARLGCRLVWLVGF